MLSSTLEVRFCVKATTLPGENVCVVGDCPELGNWLPQRAKLMKLESMLASSEAVWTQTIRLPAHKDVKYRYFIGCLREGENEGEEKDVIIRRWESNIKPRTFRFKADSINGKNAEADETTFGSYGGKESIDKGWLTGQTEVHLRLYGNPLNMWKPRHRHQTYQIKCTAMDLRYKDMSMDYEEEDSNHDLVAQSSQPPIEVSVLNGTHDVFSQQHQFGQVYHDQDYMVFRAQSFEPEFLGYQFDLYLHDSNAGPTDIPKHVGISFLLPLNLKNSMGTKTVPINGLKHRPIGQLTVEYLITKPLRGSPCDMSVSYARHWKRERRPLDVGHRGMGSTHASKCAAVRENTIASLSEAGGHGADFVEFDVQLSSDKIPVIYHDFILLLTLKKKHKDELDWFQIPVSDVSFQQLQMLKVDDVSKKKKVPTATLR